MQDVIQGVYAESTHAPMEAKMRTNRRFLACWDLPLVPYTVEVVYALGAALKVAKVSLRGRLPLPQQIGC